jgi:hypothetical protein
MRSVRKNLGALLRLRKASSKRRQKLLCDSDDSVVQSICEIAYNCLNNNIPLTEAQYKKLSPHKKTLRRLAKRGESIKRKRGVIRQCGGFLLPLLAPIIGILLQKVMQ